MSLQFCYQEPYVVSQADSSLAHTEHLKWAHGNFLPIHSETQVPYMQIKKKKKKVTLNKL